jgi:hypothetical protein
VAEPGAEAAVTESDATEVRILHKWDSNVILELIISYVTRCKDGGKGHG